METEILVIDDDAIAGGLASDILREAGFSTRMICDGRAALAIIKERHPRGVLLDILMPGIDGLSLCRSIKEDPALADIKILIVSGKSFPEEKDRAKRLGADLFIAKPYEVDTFAETVIGVVGKPQHAPGTVPAVKMAVEIKIWGCASERKSDAPDRHTPCVSVETQDHLFIFDAGSGIGPLGKELVASGKHKNLHLLLTHFHPAHIEGLGLFAPTRVAGYTLCIGGPDDPEQSLEACVHECFKKSFAADPSPVQASIKLMTAQAGDYDLAPGARLRTLYTNHPTTTLAYGLETLGRRIVYCPDSEITGEDSTALQDYDELLGKLCQGADLLIHNARYHANDYEKHKNRGHSDVSRAVEFAVKNDVTHLILFHWDASYGAAQLQQLHDEAKKELSAMGSGMRCDVAQAGMTVSLPVQASARTA